MRNHFQSLGPGPNAKTKSTGGFTPIIEALCPPPQRMDPNSNGHRLALQLSRELNELFTVDAQGALRLIDESGRAPLQAPVPPCEHTNFATWCRNNIYPYLSSHLRGMLVNIGIDSYNNAELTALKAVLYNWFRDKFRLHDNVLSVFLEKPPEKEVGFTVNALDNLHSKEVLVRFYDQYKDIWAANSVPPMPPRTNIAQRDAQGLSTASPSNNASMHHTPTDINTDSLLNNFLGPQDLLSPPSFPDTIVAPIPAPVVMDTSAAVIEDEVIEEGVPSTAIAAAAPPPPPPLLPPAPVAEPIAPLPPAPKSEHVTPPPPPPPAAAKEPVLKIKEESTHEEKKKDKKDKQVKKDKKKPKVVTPPPSDSEEDIASSSDTNSDGEKKKKKPEEKKAASDDEDDSDEDPHFAPSDGGSDNDEVSEASCATDADEQKSDVSNYISDDSSSSEIIARKKTVVVEKASRPPPKKRHNKEEEEEMPSFRKKSPPPPPPVAGIKQPKAPSKAQRTLEKVREEIVPQAKVIAVKVEQEQGSGKRPKATKKVKTEAPASTTTPVKAQAPRPPAPSSKRPAEEPAPNGKHSDKKTKTTTTSPTPAPAASLSVFAPAPSKEDLVLIMGMVAEQQSSTRRDKGEPSRLKTIHDAKVHTPEQEVHYELYRKTVAPHAAGKTPVNVLRKMLDRLIKLAQSNPHFLKIHSALTSSDQTVPPATKPIPSSSSHTICSVTLASADPCSLFVCMDGQQLPTSPAGLRAVNAIHFALFQDKYVGHKVNSAPYNGDWKSFSKSANASQLANQWLQAYDTLEELVRAFEKRSS